MNNRAHIWRWLLSLTFLNTFILCVCALPSVLTDPAPQHINTLLFYTATYVSQYFLFSVFLSLVVSPLFFYIRNDALKIIFSAIPVTAMFFFVFINTKVYAFWHIFIDSNLFQMYFSKSGSQIFEMPKRLYFWIASAISIAVISSVAALLLSKLLRNRTPYKTGLLCLLFIYVATQSAFIYFCKKDEMNYLQYSVKVPYFYDFAWANGLQAANVSLFPKQSLPVKLQQLLADTAPLHYPLHPLQYHVPTHPLNVLLIVVDTLRYDMLNPTNMPNTYQFAQHENQFLDNMSGGDCTRPGIFSLFYGIPTTYWHNALKHEQESVVIHAFKSNHYEMKLLGSAPLLWPQFNHTVFAKLKHLQTTTPGKTSTDRDIKITQEMQQFLNTRSTEKPFFGFVFYDAPHAYNALRLTHPFEPIAHLNYFEISNSLPRKPIKNLYENAVYFDDQLIGSLLQTLKKDHLMDNTVVIITADHGQEFNEEHNNYWEHASGFSKYQMRTPMVIAWPGIKPAVYHDQTTHFDLAPTLLKRVLGVSNPTSDYSVGDDFFSPTQPPFIIVGNYEYYALIADHKIMQFHDSGLYRFTDLKMNPMKNEPIPTGLETQFLNEMKVYRTA